jgi:hypothetical protein
MLVRATLVSFNLATSQASIRVDGSTPQTLDAVAVAASIPPGELIAGRRLLVDTGETGELGDVAIFATDGVSTLFGATLPALVAAASVAGSSLMAARVDHVHGQGVVAAKGDLLTFGVAPQALAAGANGLQLVADSAQAAGLKWAAPGDLSRAASLLDVVNSVAETSLFSFSLPANLLGTNRMVRLTLFGDYLNNSGATRTVTFKAKYGATTLFNDVTLALAASASRRPFRAEVELANQGATNAQVLSGLISLGLPGGTTSGLGDLSGLPVLVNHLFGSSAEDSTAAKTLDLTVTHSAASASLSIRRQYACLALV